VYKRQAVTRGLCAAGIALAGVAEVLTISRAGVIILALTLAGAALATTSFQMTPKKIAICFLVIAGAGGLAAKSWHTLKERFKSSTLEEEYGNHHNLGRGYYLRVAQAMVAEHWLGVGLNNWSYWASKDVYKRQGLRH